MNLPLINNDNVGNSYYGWASNNLDFAPESLGFTATQCADWINGFFGQSCAFANSTTFNLILPVSFESLSLPATASKFRFNRLGISSTIGNPSMTGMDSQYCAGNCLDLVTNMFGRSSTYYWAVLNSHSLSILAYSYTSAYPFGFFSCGWLKDPLFPQSAFVQNAYYFYTLTPSLRGAGRPSLGANARQNFVLPEAAIPNPIANYPVSCQIATPGANTTEFYLRDNVAPNKAVGYIPNVLKSSLNIPLGQIYRNNGIDPDGSDNPYWKCVANIGNQSIFMRVFATGIV